MKFSNRRSRQNAEISMLNLIDVIFMLLIFFMIATTFNKYSQFQLSVPKSDAKFDKKEKARIEIIVNREKINCLSPDFFIANLTSKAKTSKLKNLPRKIEPNTLKWKRRAIRIPNVWGK